MHLIHPRFALLGALVVPIAGLGLFLSGWTIFNPGFLWACFAAGGFLSAYAVGQKYWIIPALLLLAANLYLLYLALIIFYTPIPFL